MPQPMPLLSDTTSCGPARNYGLGESELARINMAVLSIVPDWSVELCGSEAADRALVVMPEDADDAIGPTYIIRLDSGQFQLEQMRFDILETIAETDRFDDLVGILRGRMGTFALMAMPRTALCH